MGVTVTHTTVNVGRDPVQVVAQNNSRAMLIISNQHSVSSLRIKFGFKPATYNTNVYLMTLGNTPTAGGFKFTYNSVESAEVAFNAITVANMQAKLRAVSGLESAIVLGDATNGFYISLNGADPDEELTITSNDLEIPLVPEVQDIVFSNTPTNGTFKLNYGGNATAAINFNDTAGTVQTKLRAVSGLSAVTVSGTIDETGLEVTFAGVDADVELLTVSDNSLNIPGTAEVQTISFDATPEAGSFKLNYEAVPSTAIAFDADAAAVQAALRTIAGLEAVTVTGTYGTNFVVTMTGVDGDLNLLTVSDNTLEDAGDTEIQTVTFSNTPDAGDFKLVYGAAPTAAIAFDDDAAAVQAALRAIAGLEAVTVAGTFGAGFAITFTGVVGDVDALTIQDNTLEVAATVEQQKIAFSAVPDAGQFTIGYGAETSAPVTSAQGAAEVQAALRALTGLGAVTVAGDYAGGFVITFTGVAGNVAMVTEASNTLTNTAVPVTTTITEEVEGVAAEATEPTVAETTPGTSTAVTPSVAETTPGVATDNSDVTVSEDSAGDPSDATAVTLTAQNDAIITDGISIPAGQKLEFLSADACPKDAIYALGSRDSVPIEILEGV